MVEGEGVTVTLTVDDLVIVEVLVTVEALTAQVASTIEDESKGERHHCKSFIAHHTVLHVSLDWGYNGLCIE